MGGMAAMTSGPRSSTSEPSTSRVPPSKAPSEHTIATGRLDTKPGNVLRNWSAASSRSAARVRRTSSTRAGSGQNRAAFFEPLGDGGRERLGEPEDLEV